MIIKAIITKIVARKNTELHNKLVHLLYVYIAFAELCLSTLNYACKIDVPHIFIDNAAYVYIHIYTLFSSIVSQWNGIVIH